LKSTEQRNQNFLSTLNRQSKTITAYLQSLACFIDVFSHSKGAKMKRNAILVILALVTLVFSSCTSKPLSETACTEERVTTWFNETEKITNSHEPATATARIAYEEQYVLYTPECLATVQMYAVKAYENSANAYDAKIKGDNAAYIMYLDESSRYFELASMESKRIREAIENGTLY